ncbi:MAG TPA: glycosyltransferase family 4 protein [Phycisphaerae bacterium]|nr:glycosyltransferase family 4 protein [Phycisphaerae bacterium]
MPERRSIALIGNYIPRRCGIATFTADLSGAIALQAGSTHDVFAVAVNDVPEGYPYPDRVRFEIRESVLADYRLAADYLNIHQVSAVSLQHEYGIFGGTYGSHILTLLRRLRRPVVTTLHTVLRQPLDEQHLILQEIIRLSDRVVVLSETGAKILREVHEAPADKIVMIPHGIPDVPFIDPNFFKDKFGVEGRKVLLTFGLLSPGKGVEYVIQAMPAIVKQHPDVMYIMLGATHPKIKRESGEEYRNSLMRMANELGVTDHVIFQNRFVELNELVEYLGAADIYITPYLGETQIVSGTLAYALGAGKATISTPYWYAAEMLADGRGRIVPFRDPDAIAEQVIDLLTHETDRHAMRKLVYNFCRKMVWKRVAQDYLDVFAEARETWVGKRGRVTLTPAQQEARDRLDRAYELPEIDLRHLSLMTDDTGMIQHCLYATPNRAHGYCTDDNARALIVAARYWEQTHDESILPLMHTYLSFLAHAMDNKANRFRNLMNYDRSWSGVIDGDDNHARALWGLGTGVALCPQESIVALATRLFRQGMPAVEDIASPRAWAFGILGAQAYLRRFGGDSEVRRCRAMLAERLHRHFTDNMTDEWPWCEDAVTYCNARLPHALLMSGKWMERSDMIATGERVLDWLLRIQTGQGDVVSIIGTDGWCVRGGPRAQFDQQPIEACAMLDACIEAYHVTRQPRWIEGAHRAFGWFLGANDLRTSLYDSTTGGCRDGLHVDRVNENQGAESTLSWLMSLLLMQELQMEQTLGELSDDKTRINAAAKSGQADSSAALVEDRTYVGSASPDRDDK